MGSIEERLEKLYKQNAEVICGAFPEWVNQPRDGFLRRIKQLEIASKRDEGYRHTDLATLMKGCGGYGATAGQIAINTILDGTKLTLGRSLSEIITKKSDGVIYGSLQGAMAECPEIVEKYYNTIADNEGETVVALNSLFMRDGGFIYIPKGVKLDQPLVIEQNYNGTEEGDLRFSRVLVIADEGAEAQVVLMSRGGGRSVVNSVREVIVESGAKIDICEVVQMDPTSVMVESSYIKQAEESRSDVVSVWFGARAVRANVVTTLAEQNSEANLHGVYLGAGEERVDINMRIEHTAPNCVSSELVKGVVTDSAVGGFTGRIVVAEDAQKTEAYQHSRNIQLSDESRVFTEPQLEIYADDVKCSHGATLGQQDDSAIYYMRQRGLSLKDAEKLRLHGFVNEIVDKIAIESVGDFVRGLVVSRIESM